MISPAYALLPVIAVLALLLWLQMRRGDRLSRQIETCQVEALNAHHTANQWRTLADAAIDVTNNLAGQVAEGDLDAGLLIHTAGNLQRARQELDRHPLKLWQRISFKPHCAGPVTQDVMPAG